MCNISSYFIMTFIFPDTEPLDPNTKIYPISLFRNNCSTTNPFSTSSTYLIRLGTRAGVATLPCRHVTETPSWLGPYKSFMVLPATPPSSSFVVHSLPSAISPSESRTVRNIVIFLRPELEPTVSSVTFHNSCTNSHTVHNCCSGLVHIDFPFHSSEIFRPLYKCSLKHHRSPYNISLTPFFRSKTHIKFLSRTS